MGLASVSEEPRASPRGRPAVSAPPNRPDALPPATRPSTVAEGRGSRGPAKEVSVVAEIPDGANESSSASQPIATKSRTIGLSELKKRKADASKKKSAAAPPPPLVSRDQVLSNLFKMLSEAEAAGAKLPGDPTAAPWMNAAEAEAPAEAAPLVPAPPTAERSGRFSRENHRGSPRPPSAATTRADSARAHSDRPARGGSGSAPGSARPRTASAAPPSHQFLRKILANKEGGQNMEAVLPRTVPTWKEDLVEKVRRRTNAAKAAADEAEKARMALQIEALAEAGVFAGGGHLSAGSSSRASSARQQRDAADEELPATPAAGGGGLWHEETSAAAAAESAKLEAAAERNHAHSRRASTEQAEDEDEDFELAEEVLTAEGAAKKRRHEREVRPRHAMLGCYRDTEMASGGFWWLLVASGGFWWLLVAAGGCWWLLVAAGGFWWLLMASNGF